MFKVILEVYVNAPTEEDAAYLFDEIFSTASLDDIPEWYIEDTFEVDD